MKQTCSRKSRKQKDRKEAPAIKRSDGWVRDLRIPYKYNNSLTPETERERDLVLIWVFFFFLSFGFIRFSINFSIATSVCKICCKFFSLGLSTHWCLLPFFIFPFYIFKLPLNKPSKHILARLFESEISG